MPVRLKNWSFPKKHEEQNLVAHGEHQMMFNASFFQPQVLQNCDGHLRSGLHPSNYGEYLQLLLIPNTWHIFRSSLWAFR